MFNLLVTLAAAGEEAGAGEHDGCHLQGRLPEALQVGCFPSLC